MSTYHFIVVHNFWWIVFFYSAYTFDWNVLPINKLRTTHIYTTLHWNDSSVEETVPLACVGLNVVTRCQVLGHSCLWPQHHNTGQSHWWLLVPAPCWEHPTISWCSAVRLLIEQVISNSLSYIFRSSFVCSFLFLLNIRVEVALC